MNYSIVVFLCLCHYSFCFDSNSTDTNSTTDLNIDLEALDFLENYYAKLNIQDYSIISDDFSGTVAGKTINKATFVQAIRQLQQWYPNIYNKPKLDETQFDAQLVSDNTFTITYKNNEVWTVNSDGSHSLIGVVIV